ncbi:hypothetical protein [Arthrobacter castelli]|uniref:hypothetical protein n=1 Tax=Arthrobacter castelli TaxID=271431 RepID=UPI000413AE1D|nr:hypothetical protein [Arthrobacter castelli]
MSAPATIPSGFWSQIEHQLHRIIIEKPGTFDEVRAILLDPAYDAVTADVNLNGVRTFGPNSAFFAGSGGESTLVHALHLAGWKTINARASYYYVLQQPDTGEILTYIEGDVERGDSLH